MRLEAPLFVWWSRPGAEQGKPWWVKVADAEPQQFGRVQLVGTADAAVHPDGSFPFADGPRGIFYLRDGYAEVS
jgi:hypothetical protein